ncbi:hypothetical protein HII31_06113, partial [Pseudocercospora fuligena]
MRTSPLLLALPLATAQQIPFLDEVKGWFAKATSSVASVVEKATESASIPKIPDPVAAASAKVAELNVEKLNISNYNEILGMINCETDGVLCHAWAVSPPLLYYLQLPQPLPDQSTPASTVRSIKLNRTTVTAPEIAGAAVVRHLQEEHQLLSKKERVCAASEG